MTHQQMQTIESAINEAIEALPDGNDRQLTDWVMANRHESFSKEVREALARSGLKQLVREAARDMGVTLNE